MAVQHDVVSHEQWLASRRTLLAAEKDLTRHRDAVNMLRLQQPWTRVEKNYVFATSEGEQTLSDLFDGRSQLLVQHFMFPPQWRQGCKSCSFMADHIDGMNKHLAHHDVTLLAVSRAPLSQIASFKARMGWRFRWVSSHDNTFNYDFRVSFTPEDVATGQIDYNFGEWDMLGEEWPGITAFFKDEDGAVYRTYSTYGRGVEIMMGTYALLDIAPLGRNEDKGMDWVTHHDRYRNPATTAKADA